MENEERRAVEPKQVIVVNRNLNMPHGKLAAQVAHASMGAFFKVPGVELKEDGMYIPLPNGSAQDKWISERFTKIVLYVKSDEKLQEVYQKAIDKGLPASLITDAGFTVFNGKPTRTCVGIGPAFPEDFIGVTDKLRVL